MTVDAPNGVGAMGELEPVLVTGRHEQVAGRLADIEADALVVSGAANIRWLTGFTGSNGVAVVSDTDLWLVTDGRYTEQGAAELGRAGSPGRVVIGNDLLEEAVGVLESPTTIALEHDVAWSWARRIETLTGSEPVAVTELIEELRAVKTPPELARMGAAAAIVDAALSEVEERIRPGTTERELALLIDDGMRARGAQGPAYETIVASGPNAALPHARPTDRTFAAGDAVIIDAGALVDGYRSDMTRTFCVGRPTPRLAEMYEVVLRSQRLGAERVAPGLEAGTIDDVCRAAIADAGMEDLFVHGTGHGVGLDIHELPRVRRGSTAILRPGHVLTVEPGVYEPGVGGVRIEDTLVVTDDGAHPLNHFPKSPQLA